MTEQATNWAKTYTATKNNPVYPTEWVVRMIAGANYPEYKYDKSLYKGKKIVDISCGDGRNLPLLINLGFDVYATETSEETVEVLSRRFPEVSFSVGFNHKHVFPDNFFDYALACGSFYYLEHNTSFKDNLKELNRILKNDAVLFASMVTKDTYVLQGSEELDNNEYLIKGDPHNFRNGYRWQVVNSKDELEKTISPFLNLIACGKLEDEYFGFLISNYIMVGKNVK